MKIDPMSGNRGSADNSSAVQRRQKARYAANIAVEMFTQGLNYFRAERTANISLGGLFVCTEYAGKTDEKVHIRIILSDRDSYFDVKTRIAWTCDGSGTHPKGLGLEFIELTDPQKMVIEKFLKDYVNIAQP
jgi:Tfp pilus assembly protein PilZ